MTYSERTQSAQFAPKSTKVDLFLTMHTLFFSGVAPATKSVGFSTVLGICVHHVVLIHQSFFDYLGVVLCQVTRDDLLVVHIDVSVL